MPPEEASGRRRFRAKLRPEGRGGKGVLLKIPFEVEAVWGRRSRMAVRGTINGFSFRGSIFPDGNGIHFMMVSRVLQEGARAAPGDTVVVVMEPDDAPRSVVLPEDFKAALEKSRAAKAGYAKLTYAQRKAFVAWLESTDRADTRSNRLFRAIQLLIEGKLPA